MKMMNSGIKLYMRQNIVVFTGAGISKESGLSTFRDSSGIWSKYDPDMVATPQGFEADPETALMFYNCRIAAVANVVPNHAHIVLAQLEKEHNVTVITQNVDDLNERAGSRNWILSEYWVFSELTMMLLTARMNVLLTPMTFAISKVATD
ncbi:MAG: hypothetical protein HDR46_04255 [Bacteroides sp.]|nr:hypothetical protein [Bacteroides sp.]